ncbi:ErmE/ErmH/ErmO/ErmR family 23S rRNA (adenine(2058)-N(6))-methyltransferase [Stackebrandtia nassauensis]|uniref:rRNA (Adenine-N(6)-)-methyltransferase n=1 Tax=Stackebrandtia nassauensis (strain DSM 44728 / CIP 108903 / NRRL B-16338 / NBRC 102104 / LLR-40K-21) TaxID=446470 RepID=D3Q6A0_STANL|nr:ErmE/ErmH/ErmO/ErmR family 23S rRNA (adenine(2058)-N(6))-methyltransferase [Stackebrandtia nassauensis]ADD42275.1 rRNA (adenine-N(6)-)-methyltransferase [Stackebrandtia nassauensis DSM 44728]
MARSSSPVRAPKRRRLSQNFLTEPRVAAAVVRLSGVTRADLVVEIGPGRGILTQAIARKAGRVLAYELDPVLAKRLAARYGDDPRVHCVHRDFLSTSPPREPFSIVANIPYARTSAIVEWCLKARELDAATLITQLEYARKRSGDYGRWSQVTVESWPRFEWRLLGRVDRYKFDPVPRVDSGILRLERRETALLPGSAMADYQRFVALGFTGVGGSLAASLRREFGDRAVRRAFARAEVHPAAVVAFVTPPQWIELFTQLCGLSVAVPRLGTTGPGHG